MSARAGTSSGPVARALEEALRPPDGRIALAARSYPDGASLEVDAERPAPIASVIKWPLRLAYEDVVGRREIDPDSTVTIEREQAPGGTGILERLSLPRELTLRDAADLMIMVSDNLATNVLIDALGGLEGARTRLDAQAGPELRLKAWARFDPEAGSASMGEASPASLLAFLDLLLSRRTPACEAALRAGELAQDRSMLPRYLPHPNLNRAAPRVAHKSGLLPGVRADAGVIRAGGRALAVAIVCKGVGDQGFGVEHEVERRIGRIAILLAHRHLAVPLPDGFLNGLA